MTYKAIVERMVERKAETWVRDLLNESGFNYDWTGAEIAPMENEKWHFSWTVNVDITSRKDGYSHRYVVVGGTVDDLVGICCSCIWDENHNIIWMAVPETRKALGIKEFKIA